MPGLAPAADSLFFASPKKSKQKKGEPNAQSLRCATGTLRCSVRADGKSGSGAGSDSPSFSLWERARATPTNQPECVSPVPGPSVRRHALASSAGPGGSGLRMSEGRAADKFANVPREPSSARKPAGPRTSARPEGAVLRTAVKWVSDPNNPQPAVLGAGGVSLELAPAALRQSRALIRHPLRAAGATRRGGGAQQPHGPSLRSAWLASARRLRPRNGAERSDGP